MNSITPELLQQLPDEVKEQLKTIEASKFYVTLIVISVLLSLHSINLQEEQLICSTVTGESCENPCILPTQLTSSTLVLAALIFFFQLACQAAQSEEGESRAQQVNLSASTLTLAAGALRFGELLRNIAQTGC